MAMLEVDHLNHEVTMSALADGVLKKEDFYLALKVNYSRSLSDIMALVDKYARVKKSKRSAQAEQLKKKKKNSSNKS